MRVVGGPVPDGASRRNAGRSRACVVALALAAILGLGGTAQAQFVERNLPPAPPRPGEAIRFITPELLKGDDQTPLGTDLHGIALIGVKDHPLERPRLAGLDLHRVGVINPVAIEARLKPFLGRPLTRKLISEIQNAITTVYREAGHGFVSVTIPPQEITGGVLQLRVFEYRVGKITVAGATRTPEQFIRDRVRVTPGETVDTRRLETDLDWLNRNPFRRTEAVFGPGRDLAQTDLTLRATETKPWQAYAGYANTGTLLTDRDRFFVGATASLYRDIVGAYQATGSKDFWGTNGHPFGDPGDAQYMSHAGRLSIPLWPRSSVELTGDTILTNERPNTFFLYRTRTSELSALYRAAVDNVVAAGFGDWFAGVESKRQKRVIFFDETEVADGRADVFQFVAGWAGHWSMFGNNDLDVRVKANPGNILPFNTSADWDSYTNGRVTDIHYAFSTIAYSHAMPLFMGLVLSTEASGLMAAKALPDTERITLGGMQQVRGYVPEDGIVDRALIVRNTLYLPQFSIGKALQAPALADTVSPFFFLDAANGRDIFLGQNTTLASVGAGFDDQIGPWFRSSLAVAYALRDGVFTPAGTWRVHVRATVTY